MSSPDETSKSKPESSQGAAAAVGVKEKKVDGWWWDLTKLAVGFLLTGVVGTAITQWYKDREIRNELHQKEVEASNKLFYDLVDSFSKRHYYASLANKAVERWNDKGEPSWRYGEGRNQMNDAYRLYEQSATEWNLGRFKMQAILQTHFGADMRRELDQGIIPTLDKTADDLDDLHEFANYQDFYAIYLHDGLLARIEGEEERAIQNFFDHLSQRLKEHENPSRSWFWWPEARTAEKTKK